MDKKRFVAAEKLGKATGIWRPIFLERYLGIPGSYHPDVLSSLGELFFALRVDAVQFEGVNYCALLHFRSDGDGKYSRPTQVSSRAYVPGSHPPAPRRSSTPLMGLTTNPNSLVVGPSLVRAAQRVWEAKNRAENDELLDLQSIWYGLKKKCRALRALHARRRP